MDDDYQFSWDECALSFLPPLQLEDHSVNAMDGEWSLHGRRSGISQTRL